VLLSFLLRGLPGAQVEQDADVRGLASDSREVREKFLFIAIQGFKLDGHDFIPQAIKNGASAVVAQKAVQVPPGTGFALVPDSRVALSHVSAVFYGHPSRHLLVAGVTGTKGKTSTSHMVKTILDEIGFKTGLIGTVHNIIGDEVRPVTHTTPESEVVQRLLREMADAGSTAASMEVSSHALVLHRVDDVEFDIGIFTNIGRDHLDFHGTVENYVEAKGKLFEMLSEPGPKPSVKESLPAQRFSGRSSSARALGKGSGPFAVLNADDPYFEFFLRKCQVEVLSYGLGPKAQVRAEDLRLTPKGTEFTLVFRGEKARARIDVPGEFNVYNALAASAVAFGLSQDMTRVVEALEKVRGVPGRAEVIPGHADFTVWVDYSHTPESLRSILLAARSMTPGNVIVVFGCGGDRDRGKRPVMGRVARELSDLAIITDDNPRSEDEDRILDDIEEGITEPGETRAGFRYLRIKDRRSAIREAIRTAGPGDIVILAGKGHETYQIFKDRTIHFDDKEEALKAISELGLTCGQRRRGW